MLTSIGSYFMRLLTSPNGRTFLLLGICVVLFILLMRKCGDEKELGRLKAQNEASVKAMQIVKTKSGKISYEKALYEGTAKQLKKTNDSLYKELKDQKGDVKVIVHTEIKWRDKPVVLDNKMTFVNDTTRGLEWEHKSSYRFIKGISTFHIAPTKDSYRLSAGKTTILNDSLKLDIITGIKEENGIFKIFVTPKTPGMTIGNIEGAIIDKPSLIGPPTSPFVTPKQKNRGGIGVHIGVGAMPVLKSNGVGLNYGPVISVGYGFNFIKF